MLVRRNDWSYSIHITNLLQHRSHGHFLCIFSSCSALQLRAQVQPWPASFPLQEHDLRDNSGCASRWAVEPRLATMIARIMPQFSRTPRALALPNQLAKNLLATAQGPPSLLSTIWAMHHIVWPRGGHTFWFRRQAAQIRKNIRVSRRICWALFQKQID